MKTEQLHNVGQTSDLESMKNTDTAAEGEKSPDVATKKHVPNPVPVHIYNHSPISLTWAREVVESYGINGPFAEALALAIVKALEERISPAITRDKLNKIFLNAVADNLDKESFPTNSERTSEI
jgi:hypothetical protein